MPYMGDDTFNASMEAWRRYEHLSYLRAYQTLVAGDFAAGRFYPLFPLILMFDFMVVHSLLVLKILVLLAIVINALTLYTLVRSVAPAIALPTLAALPLTLQIRFFHDAIIQFSLHMQTVLELVLLSAIALVAYARTSRWPYLALGTFGFLCATVTYEATYPCVFAYCFLAYMLMRGRARPIAIAAYSVVPLASGFAAVIVRHFHPVDPSSPYAFDLNFIAIVRTYIWQCFGALPLTYSAVNPAHFLPSLPSLLAPEFATYGIVALAFITLYYSCRSPAVDVTKKPVLIVVGFAALLYFGFGVMISFSGRWHRELLFGLAYTPVYFEYFALSVLLGALLWIVVRRDAKGLAFGAALALALAAGITFRSNSITLGQYHAWSMVVPHALDAGLLSGARDGDIVAVDDSYPALTQFFPGSSWDVRYFIFNHTNRKLDIRPLKTTTRLPVDKSFALVASVADFQSGVAVAGHVAHSAARGGSDDVRVDRARIYKEVDGVGTLSDETETCGSIPIGNLLAGIHSGISLLYGHSFYGPELEGRIPFRWASSSSEITLRNETERTRKATVSFEIRAARYPAEITVRASNEIVRRTARNADEKFIIPVIVASRSSTVVAVDSRNDVVPGNPGGRVLRFQIRAPKIDEPLCRARTTLVGQ